AHQDLPFEKLVAELCPERTLSHQPLFQVNFGFQSASSEGFHFPGITVLELEQNLRPAAFDLSGYMIESESGLRGFIEYATDLFDADAIERMVGHFQNFLAGIGAAPRRALAEIPLLSEAERFTLLENWGK